MKLTTHPGLWWLPDKPEQKIAGTFTFSDAEGGRLDLIGSFRIGDEPYPQGGYPIILGFSIQNGTDITLQDSFIVGERRVGIREERIDGFRSQSLYVNYAVEGAHLSTADEMRFQGCIIELAFQRDWMGVETSASRDHVDENDCRQTHVIYTFPKPELAVTNKGSVEVGHGHTINQHAKNGITVTEHTWCSIKAIEELDFRGWHQNFIYPLQTFIGLATDHWSSVRRLELMTTRHTFRRHPNVPQPLEGYFKPYNREYSEGAWVEPLFTLEQIKDDFSGVLGRWFTFVEQYTAPCELFFAVLLNPTIYLQHQFLNLAQAAEAFHRIRSGKNVTFKTRMAELVDEVWEMIPWAVGYRGQGGPSTFVDAVVATRNYYTHHDDAGRGRAVHDRELDLLAESLKLLLHATFVRELLLPAHLYKDMFKESGHFAAFRRRRW